MKTLVKKLLPPLVGFSLIAPFASAQVYFEHVVETFDGYLPPHNSGGFWDSKWIATLGDVPPRWELVDEGGGNISLMTNHANLELLLGSGSPGFSAEAQASDESPLVFSFKFYDYLSEPDGSNPVVYGELRHQFSRLFAAGFISAAADNHYQARIFEPTEGDGYLQLTERTEGWHEFKFVIFSQTCDIYVDGELIHEDIGHLAQPPLGMDRIRLGGQFSNNVMPAKFDDIYLANDPSYAPSIIITDHPDTIVSYFGETAEFTATAAGGTPPYTYQWTKDGSPLTDDGRISGAQSDTLTIASTDGPDSGEYRVIISDQDENSAESTPAILHALVEHEVIVNALDLAYPGPYFQGAWSINSETAGWFGWMSTSTQNLLDAEGNPNEERTATFEPTITETGWYEVRTFFVPSYSGWGNNRTNEAPYHVHHADGEDLVFINQQNANGPAAAQWVTVGTYRFEAGTTGKVVISNLRKGPSGDGGEEGTWGSLVIADAVRWTPTDAPPSEPPAIAITRLGADIELTIAGDPETQYTVQAVDNLGDEWVDLGTATTDPEGLATFPDANATEGARRFYRVIIPE